MIPEIINVEDTGPHSPLREPFEELFSRREPAEPSANSSPNSSQPLQHDHPYTLAVAVQSGESSIPSAPRREPSSSAAGSSSNATSGAGLSAILRALGPLGSFRNNKY